MAGEWKIDKEASKDAEGSRHIECTVCGKILKTEVIPKLEDSAGSDTTEPGSGTTKPENGTTKPEQSTVQEAVQTGDESLPAGWAVLLLLSGMTAVSAMFFKRKRFEKE